MTLYDRFREAVSQASGTGGNSHLSLLSEYAKEIANAASSDARISEYADELQTMVMKPNFALDTELVNEFIQKFGEAHFLTICAAKNIDLERVKREKGKKTPDFCFSSSMAHFEVKTPSLVRGKAGLEKSLESSLNAQIDIEDQVASGRPVAIGISEVQPYHTKTYERGQIRGVIETLIGKMGQNFKPQQYSRANTFLVVNFCMLPPRQTGTRALRPAYPDEYMFNKVLTGELWMLAFARPGMLVHGCPEFEGSPCIEGTLEITGILEDENYSSIAGLIFAVYPLGGIPHMFGLFRAKDQERWSDEEDSVWPLLTELVGQDWNDDKDSNGWRLQE